MVTVIREFPVQASPDKVIDYLKDFSHAEEWDPGTVRCVRKDAGEIAVGAQWDNTSKLLGASTDLVYELVELGGGKVHFVGKNKGSTAEDIITATPRGEGSLVRYEARIELKGASKLAGPALKLLFERKIAGEVVEELTQRLDRL